MQFMNMIFDCKLYTTVSFCFSVKQNTKDDKLKLFKK